jgi:hypothetical protein
MRRKLIAVLPKNYRHIALHAVSVAGAPVVLMDRRAVEDLSERGPLTQEGIRRCVNFEVRDGHTPILGFHDHPNEMWVSGTYSHVAEHCASQGWLEVQG